MSVNSFGHVIEAKRGQPSDLTVVERPVPEALEPGQVLARIDAFALTANNVTYALFGEIMGYWNFFPAASPDCAVPPVWGFATVTQSTHSDVKKGTQLYGFWPFAQHVVMEPDKVTPTGFTDGAAHRQPLHGFYNLISFVAKDPFCQGDTALVPALKPLFATAWLLEDFHAGQHFHNAEQLVFTSASSKTALGTAFCVKAGGRYAGQLVGVTSARNVGFVKATGLYDRVVTYDDVGSLLKTTASVIDFAGNADVLSAVHHHFGEMLGYSCQVGKTHAGAPADAGPLPGPKPTLFFAPDHARDAMERLGPAAFQAALVERWQDYLARAKSWFDLNQINGLDAGKVIFANLIEGNVKGSSAYIVSPNGAHGKKA